MSYNITPDKKSQRQVDSVIHQLGGGYSSLAACSLVSKRWNARCSQQAFRRANLADIDDLLSWSWSPNSKRIAFHISFFDILTNSTYTDAPLTSYDPERRHLWVTPSILQGYCFKTFDPIQSLTIDSVSFTFFDSNPPQHSLRNLIHTVKSLHILYPTARPGSIIRFLSAFTTLQEVTIHAPHWIGASDQSNDIECTTLSCKTLRISEFDDQSNSFLSLLGSKSNGYEKVAVIGCNFRDTVPLQALISCAGKTIRRLQIAVSPHGEFHLHVSMIRSRF